jgi:hypothetical protein
MHACIAKQVSLTSMARCLCDELDNTTSLRDLLLGVFGDISGADDDGDLRKTALSEDLGVAEGEEVNDGGLVGLLGEVLVALLGGDERPELVQVDDGLPELLLGLVASLLLGIEAVQVIEKATYKYRIPTLPK